MIIDTLFENWLGIWLPPFTKDVSGGSRISPRRGRQLSGGGRQHSILPNFPENCMKLREFGPAGGGASKILLCRSATGCGFHVPLCSLWTTPSPTYTNAQPLPVCVMVTSVILFPNKWCAVSNKINLSSGGVMKLFEKPWIDRPPVVAGG